MIQNQLSLQKETYQLPLPSLCMISSHMISSLSSLCAHCHIANGDFLASFSSNKLLHYKRKGLQWQQQLAIESVRLEPVASAFCCCQPVPYKGRYLSLG